MGENDAYEEFLSKHLQQNDDRPPIQVCNPNYARNHYLVATTRNRMTHAMKGEVGYISIMDFVAGFADMQPQMLALTRRLNRHDFIDQKVGGVGFDDATGRDITRYTCQFLK